MGLLLDTCAIIYIARNAPMSAEAEAAVRESAERDELLVSAISAWEIGLLSRPRPNRLLPDFAPDPLSWFEAFLGNPGVRLAPFSPAIAIGASALPGQLHADPADRLLISTARQLKASLLTSDRKILAYAAAGYVQAIAC